jgi:hypothetical protein
LIEFALLLSDGGFEITHQTRAFGITRRAWRRNKVGLDRVVRNLRIEEILQKEVREQGIRKKGEERGKKRYFTCISCVLCTGFLLKPDKAWEDCCLVELLEEFSLVLVFVLLESVLVRFEGCGLENENMSDF